MGGANRSRRPFIHPTADVSPQARIGPGTEVWNLCQIREGVVIGADSIVGHMTYIGPEVKVGDRCRIFPKVSMDRGVEIGNDVFLAPHVVFTNDNSPRAWKTRDLAGIRWYVEDGASLAAHVVVLPEVSIGHHAMIAAHSTVTRHVPPHGLALGTPARLVGWVSTEGYPMERTSRLRDRELWVCPQTGEEVEIPKEWLEGKWQPNPFSN